MTVKVRSIVPAIIANRYVYVNSNDQARAMEKLSSGLEIVRAADGPSSLIISEQMRSQIKGLNQALDNSEVAVSLIKTTESALAEINKMLNNLRQLAVHASNEAVNDIYMLDADQQEVDNILDAIDRIAKQSAFGRKKLLNGTNSSLGIAIGDKLDFIKASENTNPSPENGYEVVLEETASKASVTTENITREMLNKGLEVSLQDSGNVMKMEFDEDLGIDGIVNQLNLAFEKHNVNVEAILINPNQTETNANPDSSQKQPTPVGRIVFQSKDYGSKQNFYVGFNQDNVIGKNLAHKIEFVDNGKDVKGTIGGETARGEGQILRGVVGSKTQDVEVKYKGGEQLSEPTKVGVVLIRQNAMRFQIGGNYGETKSLAVDSIYTKDLAQLVENESGLKSLQELDVTNFEKAQDSLKLIEKATIQISSLRAELGAFQKNNLESNIESLGVGVESIVNSESVIRDADVAEKFVDLTRTQIMRDTALSMLTHSKQSTQKAMQLINPN